MTLQLEIERIVELKFNDLVSRHKNLLDQRSNDLLTRTQVINDYHSKGITSFFKISTLEKEHGLKRASNSRPIYYRRSDVESVLNTL